MSLNAIILSAGASLRMGSPKALLSIEGKSFLQHIVGELQKGGIKDITIVLGAEHEHIRETLVWFNGDIVINHNWQQGQLSSLNTGIKSIEKQKNVTGVIVCPVDHPLISSELISALSGCFTSSGKKIIIPTYEGKRGHPVIFSRDLFDEIKRAPLDTGARAVVHAHPTDIMEMQTNEANILRNIDTPSDYTLYIRQKTL